MLSLKRRTVNQLADLICGNFPYEETRFVYRSSKYLTEFFEEIDTEYAHDGSTRNWWVAGVITEILAEPSTSETTPPDTFSRLIERLMDRTDAVNESSDRTEALAQLNTVLERDGFQAFYGPDGKCYLRHLATNANNVPSPNPHRPFSAAESLRRTQLASYLDEASEDSLIEEVLLPLLRQLGFHRVSVAGHKDKALEYGKDLWMRYTLPTQHFLYFGIQAKKGKLDASGAPNAKNVNMAEIHNQALMMLGHDIFDPEISKHVLVDHAIIVAGGEITKAARNWLGNKLDASKRSQILFMDREDILNLYVVTSLPLPFDKPSGAQETELPPF